MSAEAFGDVASLGERLDPLVKALRGAQRVTVLTGAGTSAESGVPTFRDAQTGLWARYRAEDLATPEAFARDPSLVWEWYQWRREAVRAAQPNAGHHALCALGERLPEFQLVTQNVDGLHQRAGHNEVIELHGNILASICSVTRKPIQDDQLAPDTGPPPSPFDDRGLARPAVVWFGEALPEEALQAALKAASQCDVMLVLGTSGLVQPAASLPLLALEAGAWVSEINPQPTPLSHQVQHSLRATFAQALPALIERLQDR